MRGIAQSAVAVSRDDSHWKQVFNSGALRLLLFTAFLMSLQSMGADTTNRTPVTIEMDLSRGRIMVRAIVNGSNALSFLLDTGYGINTIRPDLVEPLDLKRAGQVTIVGIAGEEKAPTYNGAVFDLGGAIYSPRRVASLPSEAQTRHHRDGILGAGFFRRFVVEIYPEKNQLLLHDPETFQYEGKGQIIPLEFDSDTPIIEARILSPSNSVVAGRFEIDTGCDDSLCLGREFIEANHLAGEEGGSSGAKRGVGGSARIRRGSVAELRLGGFVLEKLSANFFTDGSPAGPGLAGHIGMAALRNYRVIFDYSRKRIILEPLH
ncbi:MAG: pepsin/retropepsin-like aspartic protease family protein [Verrucomicrobiota bacterium]